MINLQTRRMFLAALLFSAMIAAGFSNFTYMGAIDGTGVNNNTPYNTFLGPYGLAHDGTYLFVSDDMKGLVYQLVNNTVVKRIGSSGSSIGEFLMPKSMLAKDGKVYIADSGNNRVQYYSYNGSSSGTYSTFDTNTGTTVQQPGGVTYLNGYYYVTSIVNSRIVLYDASSLRFSSIFGNTGAYDDGIDSPTGITTANNLIFVSDSGNNRIKAYSSNLTFLYPIGIGKGGIQLSNPQGIYATSDTLYVADTGNNRIVLFTLDGFPIEAFGSKGGNNTQFDRPTSVIENNGTVYVADYNNKKVKMFHYEPNITSSTLLDKLAAARANSSAVMNLTDLAARALNLSFSPRSGAYVLAAQQYYDNNSLSQSYEAASTAIRYAQEDMANFGGSVGIELRSRLSVMSDGLARLKNQTYPQGYVPDFNAVENLMKSVNSKIASGDFIGALADYQSASSRVTELDLKATSPQGGGNSGQQNATSNETIDDNLAVQIEIAQVSARFEALKQRSATYKQDTSYDDIAGSIAVAKAQLSAGSVYAANVTISQASNLISGYSSNLEQKIPDIDRALANISAAGAQISAIAQQGYVIHPDVSQAKAKIDEARALAYSSPSQGVSLAAQALSDAQGQTGREILIFGAIGAVILIVAIIAAAIVAFLVVRHLKRRRKGL